MDTLEITLGIIGVAALFLAGCFLFDRLLFPEHLSANDDYLQQMDEYNVLKQRFVSLQQEYAVMAQRIAFYSKNLHDAQQEQLYWITACTQLIGQIKMSPCIQPDDETLPPLMSFDQFPRGQWQEIGWRCDHQVE